MADAVVSVVVNKLGDYLGDYLKQAAAFLQVRSEVESLKKDLEWMLGFVKDAEDKQVDNSLIRLWVSDIKDIAYDSEDVLDKFMLKVRDGEIAPEMLKVKEEASSNKRQKIMTSMKKPIAKLSRKAKETVTMYKIGKEIEALKNRLSDVSDRRVFYGLRNINIKTDEENHALRRMKQLRKTTSFSLEEKVVGYEDETNELLAKLLADEPRRWVISIWGTGGLGKTTLAGKLYKNSEIKKKSIAKSSRKGKEKVSMYKIGREIEALKKKLSDVSRRRQEYGLENINTKRERESPDFDKLKQLRKTNCFSFEGNVVGYKDETGKLLAKLLDNEPRRYVISIWGTGGLGKTTLARKLYNNSKIKQIFSYSAWVSVSQDYNTQDLLGRIIKSLYSGNTPEKFERMSQDDMERYLHKSLQGCRYLVVIDDVWHKEAWASLKRAFPDNKNGSRVIITTRIKDVAESSDQRTHIHELRFLNQEESWQLFCEKACCKFNIDEGLEKLGREMVEKCGGLPLAIVVLGGLLSRKKPQAWNLVRDNIWRHLRNDNMEITQLLALSFNDLPYQLKLCFLYLSNFPEDKEIKTEKLIRLWVAEGYIPHDEEIMEDMALNYLNELINRSLIQKGKMRLGMVTTCRVHDLLRDLAIQKAKELNLVQIYDEIRNSAHSSKVSCRRLAVYTGNYRTLRLRQCNPLLRSLLIFDRDRLLPTLTQFIPTLCTKFRFLRVLEFERGYPRSCSLPKDIGKLIHLKYLGIQDSVNIPESILNLSNLETLHFNKGWASDCYSPPTEIWKLKSLRHLIGDLDWPLRIDNMTNLQTLKVVRDNTWTKTNSETLVNLRELELLVCHEREKKFTFDSIAKLKSIQILTVKLSDFHFFPTLQPLSHCRYLRHLKLDGKMEKLPGEMHVLLPNVESLSLTWSKLVDDPMPILEKMLNLTELELGLGCYLGKKMVCTAKGFPRLEFLILDQIDLEEWQIEEGALPVLRGLRLLKHLHSLPKRLKSLPRLP
ncbi:disease resistance protein RPP13-like [Pistacia vera]|uniref:disease resistance protein RPP13-like n=1 Tax=Pistacia vera TaxID=55513 RepID=UPI001263D7D5|nr:disease resistance protein RPP13-like [Pistacia vera]